MLAYCKECDMYGHTDVRTGSKMSNIEELKGMSCFEMLHSNCCKGLFGNSKERRTVSTKHHIYASLLKDYNVPKKKGNRPANGKVSL